jgi:hypothetical protein
MGARQGSAAQAKFWPGCRLRVTAAFGTTIAQTPLRQTKRGVAVDRSDRSSSRTARSFIRLGTRDGVQLFQREDTPAVELVAVGEIDALPAEVHRALLEYVDPRTLASLAESWSANGPPASTVLANGLLMPNANVVDFSLRTRSTDEGAVRVSFQVADERGDITRVRNWVVAMRGAWKLDSLDDREATRVFCHIQIDFANPLPQWTLRAGALQDLSNLFQCLRWFAESRRPHRTVAARRAL